MVVKWQFSNIVRFVSNQSLVYLGYIALFVPIHVGEGKAEEEGNYEDFADETTKNII